MPKKIGQWTQLSSKIKYQNPWIKVREHQVITPSGKRGIYGVVETAPSVFAFPMTKDNRVILIKLFRFTTKSWGWELPAGGSEGKSLLRAVKRELLEETGYKANSWKKLGKMAVFNGVTNEIMHLFIAKDLVKVNYNEQIEEGITEIKDFSYVQIKKMIKTGELRDCQSISAIFMAANYLNWK